jgi:hypothetical protein
MQGGLIVPVRRPSIAADQATFLLSRGPIGYNYEPCTELPPGSISLRGILALPTDSEPVKTTLCSSHDDRRHAIVFKTDSSKHSRSDLCEDPQDSEVVAVTRYPGPRHSLARVLVPGSDQSNGCRARILADRPQLESPFPDVNQGSNRHRNFQSASMTPWSHIPQLATCNHCAIHRGRVSRGW